MKKILIVGLMFLSVLVFGRVTTNDIPKDSNSVPCAMIADAAGDEADVGTHNDLTTRTTPSKMLEDGNMFHSTRYNNALANGGNIVIVSTPVAGTTSNHTHMTVRLSAGGDGYFRLYETPTITSMGTAITEVNHNRTSSVVSCIDTFYGAVASSSGTLIMEVLTQGGSTTQSMGNIASSEEFILSTAKTYLYIFENISGSTDDFQLTLYYFCPD